MITIPTPSIGTGPAEIQTAQIKSYLIQLADTLQYSLNNIGYDSLDSSLRAKISALTEIINGE